jgi:hypothetical protein
MQTQMIKNKLACFLSNGLSISPNAAALGTPRVAGAQSILLSVLCASSGAGGEYLECHE